MGETFLNYLSQKKTFFFLLMCLFVHAFNTVLFYFLGIYPLSILNIFSTIFYVAILFFFKHNTDSYIIFTYFEIVLFSFVSELISGGGFFYIFFIIGMISAIFYLLPPKRKMKHIFQGIGVVFAVLTYYLVYVKDICLFPEYRQLVIDCKNPLGFLSLCITVFTLFYISNLYFFELNSANEKLAYTSNHDLLTGLFNRRFFEYIMKRNKSENENEYTIAIFDIDDFKKINDTYGHQAGDNVLKMVSKVIEGGTDKEYIPVRWGGEEFILFMPETEEDKAYEYLQTLCEQVRSTIVDFDGRQIKVTMTVGMCTGMGLVDYEGVIRVADDRLYTGKRNGKNQVVCR